MDFLAQYGIFLLKSLTIVFSILFLAAGLFSVGRKTKPKFEITSLNEDYDATLVWNIVDGAEFEIYSISTVQKINQKASLHEKEHFSLYIRNNPSQFKINRILPPEELIREDIRLTVDNPEDLIFCREIYRMLKEKNISMSLSNILKLLDENPNMIDIIKPFLANGHEMMRYWNE